MPRISGIEIPQNKRTEIALTYIYGIGRQNVDQILKLAHVDANKRAKDLTGDEVVRLQKAVETIQLALGTRLAELAVGDESWVLSEKQEISPDLRLLTQDSRLTKGARLAESTKEAMAKLSYTPSWLDQPSFSLDGKKTPRKVIEEDQGFQGRGHVRIATGQAADEYFERGA